MLTVRRDIEDVQEECGLVWKVPRLSKFRSGGRRVQSDVQNVVVLTNKET